MNEMSVKDYLKMRWKLAFKNPLFWIFVAIYVCLLIWAIVLAIR